MRTRAKRYPSPALKGPRRTVTFANPLVQPATAALEPREPSAARDLLSSVALATLAAFLHCALVSAYGRTCGIDVTSPSTWVLGLATVNSTWCGSIHWMCQATAMCTDRLAASACLFLAMRTYKSRE